jgi:uncharacterized protein YegL
VKELTEIVCIIDKSGSMSEVRNDAIGGFNMCLEEQQSVPGDATLTLVLFDTEYSMVHQNKPLSKVPPLTKRSYSPGGMTALLDAIGKTIHTIGQRLSDLPEEERPSKVIVAILTDGEENSSREYNLTQVKEMIQHQKEIYSWEFVFLGANQDTFAEAAKLGIDAKDTVEFAANSAGITRAYTQMSNITMSYR